MPSDNVDIDRCGSARRGGAADFFVAAAGRSATGVICIARPNDYENRRASQTALETTDKTASTQRPNIAFMTVNNRLKACEGPKISQKLLSRVGVWNVGSKDGAD